MSGELKALAAALDRIDFATGNAEIESVRAELAHVEAKDAEIRDELSRLAEQIRSYRGPSGEQVAAAVLAGAQLADAAFAGESRAELGERRDALQSARRVLAATADQLRTELLEAKGRARRPIIEAVQPYLDHLLARQREAAEVLYACDAEVIAIARGLNIYVDHESASRRAREAVSGPDSLLGLRDVLKVPQDLVAVLRPLSDKSAAVSGIPTEVSTR